MLVKGFWIYNLTISGTLVGWFSLYWIDLFRGTSSFGMKHVLFFIFVSHAIASYIGYRKFVVNDKKR